ncbi:MAG: hypothetical protein H0W88_07320 [Parachlamydiaceae bacterium]|nr:hypothetical protein [Parachlamydiaceae bacterium]
MKKQSLKKIALLGLAGGVLLCNTSCENSVGKNSSAIESQKQLSASELYTKLNSVEKKEYDSLDMEGKKLALSLANQSCAGKNECKGLNSCKTDSNSCKGLGSCKGTSVGPFKDKNDAVKVAAMRMADKRRSMTR